ncbi:hypothetical protein POM88_035220 [Heracleum sosnowskyi]|uniref:TF-B3 domain-containing protein n=1 Tax=Heracleum sosnowskyi TaxID=360622 RepID=A0AAD8HLW9_9APIA|nr:hypothetical protein POM88_035220 [Heracleum sosnowskyi]
MASSDWSNSTAKSSRFFKIMLTDIGSHSKLMIPTKFVKIFRKNLDNRIHLSAPRGSVWSVDLEKQKDEVWLQNGWPEFAKFYSISFGYLLVFEYKGDAKFEVLIFDPSAVEIDYPLTCSASLDFVKSIQVKKKEIDLNDATHSEAIRPRKKTRSSSALVELCHNEQKLGNVKVNVNGKSACNGEGNRALVLAKAFKSEKPFFILSVQPSYVDGNSHVHVPVAFREVYTKWMNNVEVNLKVGSRTWPVYSHLNLKRKRCLLGSGWAGFSHDNSLKVGDACVFELINPTTKLFKVFKFRATGEAR